ncbi:unnamed protein product [Moneuplotes crassus]|uniref:DUSP domain-containing protein n=1 Tax=Euplotes crassus TaxID=5936 RepID=A0AAD1Y768_EUPCR|nr:unnamed protein product [Moneuplotes crassus]
MSAMKKLKGYPSSLGSTKYKSLYTKPKQVGKESSKAKKGTFLRARASLQSTQPLAKEHSDVMKASKQAKRLSKSRMSGKISLSSVQSAIKRSNIDARSIGMSSPVSSTSELNCKGYVATRPLTQKSKDTVQAKKDDIQNQVHEYFKKYSSKLVQEVNHLKLEMSQMKARISKYEKCMLAFSLKKATSKSQKCSTDCGKQPLGLAQRSQNCPVLGNSSKFKTKARKEAASSRNQKLKDQKYNQTPQSSSVPTKLRRDKKSQRAGSRAYFSLNQEPSYDDKADITYDNDKEEDIVLPLFTGHYVSKDLGVKNRTSSLMKPYKRKKAESLEAKLQRNKSFTSNTLQTVFLNLAEQKDLSRVEQTLPNQSDFAESCKSPMSFKFESKRGTPGPTNLMLESSIEKRGVVNRTKLHFNQKLGSYANSPRNKPLISRSVNEMRKVRQLNSFKSLNVSLAKLDGTCICREPRNLKDPESKSCGTYCKYLSSNEQKDIIFRKYQLICAQSISERFEYVLPADWWKIWCDFVNIEYKTFAQHCKDTRLAAGSFLPSKTPGSTLRISEESDIEFDMKTFDQEAIKAEAPIQIIQDSRNSCDKSNDSRLSIIPNDDRYNEIYTRPGKIINKQLIERVKLGSDKENHLPYIPPKESQYELKSHLQELHDYILVSKESWKNFRAWYGSDFEINFAENKVSECCGK